ncbi:potassium channel family protein [Micromonospora fluostatini]|uniref:potassium channel family protein n=1 Tax=Micromonospora sp. JCM 30529 TaxID=3421643 RepID=UPI003D17BC32
MSRRRPYRKEQRRTILACALLVLVYFVVPVQPDANGPRLAVRAVLTVVAVIVVALLVTGQVRRQLAAERAPAGPDQAPSAAGAGPAGGDGQVRSLAHLAVALVAGLLAFALADYVIAVTAPEQFVNLRTRVDALYFALATLTTIGYGDVHAEGQFARSVVAAQMVFSIGVIATGLSLVLKHLTRPTSPPPRG